MSSQWASINQIALDVNAGKFKAVDLVKQSLKTIEDKKDYQAIIITLEQNAIKRAEQIDLDITNGKNAGRLAGVPFIAKDNFLVFGGDTTAASNILKGFKAPYQSTVINKLEAEGAICVAKANLDAFAHGSSTQNSDFFVTKNPIDNTRVPGGSSGGSASSVVLDMAPFALGTDTGGSIRQPASFSGCIGLKPSYGLVSRSGVVAMASSTDVIGPLTRTVADSGLILDIIAGRDALDSTTVDRQNSYLVDESNVSGKKIGVIKEYMDDRVNEDVKAVINQSIEKLKAAGAIISEVSLPSSAAALAVYYILCPAEVSSNLSRYDGQRYGHSDKSALKIDDSYNLSRGQGFGKEAKRRIIIGTYVLSSGYYDAYYKKAQLVRTKLIKEFEAAIQGLDYLIGPVAPTTAYKIGENVDDPIKAYLGDIMTVTSSLVGNPSISIPAGLSDNLPVGLQVMARHKQDKELIDVASAMEAILS
jgi:aspartyl-tRNA(Asn)/glutamyl-tRNA(Gln) amidotransferase subunit A